MVVEEIIPIVDVEGQVHFSSWEGPVQEYGGAAFIGKESLVIGFPHNGPAGGDGAA